MKNYEYAKSLLFDKEKAVEFFIKDFLIKCNKMFIYKNVPETLLTDKLEYYLQSNGSAIVTMYDNKLVAFSGGYIDDLDLYYNPKYYQVNNPYINLSKKYTINQDCILIKNDYLSWGLLPTIQKYSAQLIDAEISLNVITRIMRNQLLISANDTQSKESAELYIEKLDNGDLSVIADNPFLEGIKLHNGTNGNNAINQFIELTQYYRATLYNELGINANYNLKRERLSEGEIALNNDILLPLVENMLDCRKNAIEKINEKYGTEIEVDLYGIWKEKKELNDNTIKQIDTKLETETVNETVNETVDETADETVNETVVENKKENKEGDKNESKTE